MVKKDIEHPHYFARLWQELGTIGGEHDAFIKVIIIERKSYHERTVTDADRGPYSNFAMGFVDGHVVYLNSKIMFDRDINWTGRGTEEAGVLGRDVP